MTSARVRGLGVARSLANNQPWAFYVGFGLGRTASIISLPIVSRALGPSNFGQYEVATALVTVATVFFDAGVGTAVVRFANDKRMPWARLLAVASRVQLGASLVATIVLVPAQFLLAPSAVTWFDLAGITLCFAVVEGLAAVASGALRARGADRRFLMLSVGRLVVTVLASGIGADAAGIRGSLLGLALGGLPMAVEAVRITDLRIGGDREARNLILGYGAPLILGSLALWVLAMSDRLFLQHRVSHAVLGQYGANYRMGSVILTFLAGPVALAWVSAARRAGSAALREARRWALGYTIAAGILTIVLSLGAPIIVPAFYGSQFRADPYVVAMVAVAGWLGGLYPFVATSAFMADSTLRLSIAAVPVLVIAFTFNATLIPAMGAHGAADATLLSYLTLCVVTWLLVPHTLDSGEPQ